MKDFLQTLQETTTQQPNMVDNPFFINLPVVSSSATTLPAAGGGAAESSTGNAADASTAAGGGILGLGGIMRGLRFN